jgi:hypothetical protein
LMAEPGKQGFRGLTAEPGEQKFVRHGAWIGKTNLLVIPLPRSTNNPRD